MNNFIKLFVPAAFAAVLAVQFSLWFRVPASPSAGSATLNSIDLEPLNERLRDLGHSNADLAMALHDLESRLASVEIRSASTMRAPVVASVEPELSSRAIELIETLASGSGAPPGLDAWLEQAMAERERSEREEREASIHQTLNDFVSERIDLLAEELELYPDQVTELESVLNAQAASFSALLAEAESPLELMQAVGPLREERDAQLERVLTTEQMSSFKELASNPVQPGFLFGSRPR